MVRSAPWYRRHQALFILGVFLLLQAIIWPWLPGPAATWSRTDRTLLEFKPEQLTGMTQDTATKSLKTMGQPSYITWPAAQVDGVLHVVVRYRELPNRDTGNITLQYTTREASSFDDDVIHSRSVRAQVEREPSQTTLSWNLPCPAESIRLSLKPGSELQQLHVQMSGQKPEESSWHLWRQVLVVVSLAVSFSLFILWLSQYVKLLGEWKRSPAAISLTWLTVQGVVMIWLLPPFQGPDENRHWKTAVELFCNDGQAGSVLYRLPVLLDAESTRWRAEVPYRVSNTLVGAVETRSRAENIKVTYTRHWGYPTVGLVALLFPPVQTVHEALLFYYTCRFVNLLCLLMLVAYAWKLGLGSWTLVTFLSFPLVLQQCVIVSTDTVHNLGAFWAVLLFCKQLRNGTRWNWWLLLIVSCLVVAAKPPIYLLILLLPGWFLPWQQWRRPQYWLPALLVCAVILSAGIWYMWHIVDGSGMQLGDEARQQLRFVMTGPGLATFFNAAMEYPSRFLHPADWYGPLGWLDTNLSELHVALLWISFWTALTLDTGNLIRYIQIAGAASLWDTLPAFVGVLSFGLFVWWSLALVMYLTITGHQSAGIVGMQVRYMVPVVILLLLWPRACVTPGDAKPTKPVKWITWLSMVLCLMALVRAGLLALDLQVRYWG